MATNPRTMKSDYLGKSPETGPGISSAAIQARVDSVDWAKVNADLDAQGWAVVPKLLTHAEADSIAGLTIRRKASAAASSWLGTASVGASTSTSATRCRL
jgi:hypothetical protein